MPGTEERLAEHGLRLHYLTTWADVIAEARRGGELTPDDINALWMSVQAESLGSAFEFMDGYETFWAYIPHFVHSPFYVYAYAFGDGLVGRASATGDVLFRPDDPDHPCGTVHFFPGHGHFDLAAYDAYHREELPDYELDESRIEVALKELPQIPA